VEAARRHHEDVGRLIETFADAWPGYTIDENLRCH
jgi:hypothetical protein